MNNLTKSYVGNKTFRVSYNEGLTGNTYSYYLDQILFDNGYIKYGNYYFYLRDHLGNNRVVVDGSGNIVQRNDYYPFGMPFAEDNGAGV